MNTALNTLNAKSFSAQLHTFFQTQLRNPEALSLELVEVREPPTAPQFELFCLIFRGPGSPRMAQQIHHLQHETLGAIEIFLTAIGTDETGIYYESVFFRRNNGGGK